MASIDSTRPARIKVTDHDGEEFHQLLKLPTRKQTMDYDRALAKRGIKVKKGNVITQQDSMADVQMALWGELYAGCEGYHMADGSKVGDMPLDKQKELLLQYRFDHCTNCLVRILETETEVVSDDNPFGDGSEKESTQSSDTTEDSAT